MDVATSTAVAVNQERACFCALPLAESHSNEEETMERRTFLSALTGVSLGALLEVPFTEVAGAQNRAQTGADQVF